MEQSEEQLLNDWQMAEARVTRLERDSDAWHDALRAAWRAQMAYRDAVHARVHRQGVEAQARRKHPDVRSRRTRSRAGTREAAS